MKEYSYIDDRAYAESYVRLHKESAGRRRISSELKMKKLDDEMIAQALTAYTDEEERASADRLAKKYMLGKPNGQKAAAGLFRYLQTRGFARFIASDLAMAYAQGEEEDESLEAQSAEEFAEKFARGKERCEKLAKSVYGHLLRKGASAEVASEIAKTYRREEE